MSEGIAPLLPTVCALALLPGGDIGLAYVPSALRHLMADADSPVADLYKECLQCTELNADLNKVTAELIKVGTSKLKP